VYKNRQLSLEAEGRTNVTGASPTPYAGATTTEKVESGGAISSAQFFEREIPEDRKGIRPKKANNKPPDWNPQNELVSTEFHELGRGRYF